MNLLSLVGLKTVASWNDDSEHAANVHVAAVFEKRSNRFSMWCIHSASTATTKANRSMVHLRMNPDELRRRYVQDPTAFWTTCSRMKRISHRYRVDDHGVFHGNGVFSFSTGTAGIDDFDKADAVYLPADSTGIPTYPWLPIGEGCLFRHRSLPEDCGLPDGYQFVTAHAEDESDAIIEAVNACYDGNRFDKANIRRLLDSAAYEPELWIWAVDEHDTPVGLFISEFDHEIGEVSLDWCQVMPEHQGCGIGRALVAETVRRADDARLITVGTQSFEAGRFYERCGFVGRQYRFYRHADRELLSYEQACGE